MKNRNYPFSLRRLPGVTPAGIIVSSLALCGAPMAQADIINLTGDTTTLSEAKTISVVDQYPLTSAVMYTPTSGATVIKNFTVSSTANMLIVELGSRNNGGTVDGTISPTASVASMSYNGQAMTQAVAQNGYRLSGYATSSNIWYLANPGAVSGSNDLSVTFSSAVGANNPYSLNALTLSGASTTTSPVTGSSYMAAGNTAITPLVPFSQSVTMENVVAGSFGAVSVDYRIGPGTSNGTITSIDLQTGTGTAGNPVWTAYGTNFIIGGGYVSNLSAGTDTLVGVGISTAGGPISRSSMAAAAFAPSATGGVVNRPGTAINVTATSTLDLGETGTPVNYDTLGALGIASGAILSLQNGANINFNGISATGAGSASIGNGSTSPVISLASSSNVDVASGVNLTVNSTVGNPLSGTTALTKTGIGALVLTGTNTYTGATSVNAGKLWVGVAGTGSITSNVTVASGAAAGGYGTITGNVTLAAESALNAKDGGKLIPGNSLGVLTATGTTTVNTGSIFTWTIDTDADTPGRGTEYAGLNAGSVTGSGAVFEILTSDSEGFGDNFWTSNHNWSDIFKNATGTALLGTDWTTVFSSFAYSNGTSALSTPTNGNFSWTNSGNTLTWTAVPEPTTALAGLLLGAGLLRRRRAGASVLR